MIEESQYQKVMTNDDKTFRSDGLFARRNQYPLYTYKRSGQA